MTKKIESLSHPTVKRLRALRMGGKLRESERRVVVFGKECLDDLFEAFGFGGSGTKTLNPVTVFSTDEQLLARFDASFPVDRLLVSKEVWQKISGLNSEIGIGVELDYPESYFHASMPFPEEILNKSNKILVLDGISDPGNMGTLLRSAWAFGYHTVCLTPGCAHPFNDKALRSSKGISLKLTLIQTSTLNLIAALKKSQTVCISAHMQGREIQNELKVKGRVALIVGNEARGVNPALLEMSQKVCIRMEAGLDSLNAAVAGSLLMWQL